MTSNAQRRHLPDGVIPPKYVLKFIEKNGATETRVYFDKNVMIGDLNENWGRFDIFLQEFLIQKTMQPCLYRFYRNERNVYRAECHINRKSIKNDTDRQQIFSNIFNDI